MHKVRYTQGQMANQHLFESRKRRKFTPEIQVTGLVRRRGEDTVSPERIYQYVYSDYDHARTLYLHLRQPRKKRRGHDREDHRSLDVYRQDTQHHRG
jgi:IS30 family transposase